jgi:hypothetical protein
MCKKEGVTPKEKYLFLKKFFRGENQNKKNMRSLNSDRNFFKAIDN